MTTGTGARDRAAAIRRMVAAGRGTPDLIGSLRHLCQVAARELAASGVGVSVMTEVGVRGLSAASDDASERFEELQFVLGEGPCIDAFDAWRPVLAADVEGYATDRWPVYAPAVHEGGVRAVFAFPLQIGAVRLGILNVFRDRAGPLTGAQLRDALLFADVTVESLLDRQADEQRRGVPEGLVWEAGNRAQLFQAQGMVMVQLGASLGEALARMRAHAYAEDRRLNDVAHDVVNRRLQFERDVT